MPRVKGVVDSPRLFPVTRAKVRHKASCDVMVSFISRMVKTLEHLGCRLAYPAGLDSLICLRRLLRSCFCTMKRFTSRCSESSAHNLIRP